MKEKWKQIKGYSNYQVSNKGRVRSNKNKTRCYRVMTTIEKSDGYLCINLMKDSKMKQFVVHRLVAQAFKRNPKNLPIVNHKDRNKKNNIINNLEWCTARHNVSHSCKYLQKTTDVTGVHIQLNSFIVRMGSKGISLNLGSYKTKKEAEKVYKKAVSILELRGHSALIKYKQSLYNKFSSKYMGVTFCKTRNKWVANVIWKGVKTLCKRFNTEEQAVKAVIRNYKKIKRPLHFSHLKYLKQ